LGELIETVRNADPRHPIMVTENWPESFESHGKVVDALCVEPFPTDKDPHKTLREHIQQAHNSIKSGATFWVTFPQVIDPSGQSSELDSSRMKTLIYLSLMQGAKGVFFSRLDSGESLDWANLGGMAGEVEATSGVWLTKKFDLGIQIEPNDGEALMDSRIVGRDGYLIVVNASSRKVVRTFNFAGRTRPERISVLFQDRNIYTIKRSFVDSFEPYAVHVYKFPMTD